ncbi:MAG TPA: SGNH/GDSL hydrolase family protein [bacterium]|nr:SGNH/GDSL hydrolase family protein [bacterium]
MCKSTFVYHSLQPATINKKWSGRVFSVKKGTFYQMSFSSIASKKSLCFVNFYNSERKKLTADFCSEIRKSNKLLDHTYFFRTFSNVAFAKVVLENQGSKILRVKNITVEEKEYQDIDVWIASESRKIPVFPLLKIEKKHLTKTAELLKTGGKLKIVFLGDSIVNDMANSFFDALLRRVYPAVKIEVISSVRNTTGCWYFKHGNRVKKLVIDYSPDLVIIGGISHRNDVSSIKSVIEKIRRYTDVEIVVTNGAFGKTGNPWKQTRSNTEDEFSVKLKKLSDDMKFMFFDTAKFCRQYIHQSGKPYSFFLRDNIHPNHYGRFILSYLLFYLLSP